MRFVIIALALYEIFSIAVMPMLPLSSPPPYSSLSPIFPVCASNPQTHLQNSDACVSRARAAPLPGKLCVIPRLARQLGSLVARWLGSLLRLTPTSAVLFLFCVKRARFALGLTSIGHRFCAKIFPQKKGCPWQRNFVNNT